MGIMVRKGSVGPYVRLLKERLKAAGVALPLTSQFDAATRDAVIAFQKAHTTPTGTPLECDGVVGPDTWRALGGPPGPIIDRAGSRGRQIVMIAMGESMRGVHEQGGNNRGKDVAVYQRVTNTVGQAWCASFVSWCYQQAGIPLHDANGFAAVKTLRNWAKTAGHWRPRDDGYMPPEGSIVIYTFSHTGILVAAGESSDTTVEGNTGAGAGGSQRDGDGVYRRTRVHTIIAGYVVIPEILA
jgi:hypothetical protein